MNMTVLGKMMLCVVSAVLPFWVEAQEHEMQTDTVKVINDASSVVITRCDSTTRIMVNGNDKDPRYQFTYEVDVAANESRASKPSDRWMPSVPIVDAEKNKVKPHKKFSYVYLRDWCIGALIPLDAPQGVDPSVEYGFNCVAGLAYRPWRRGPEFSIGIGLADRRLSIHNGKMLGKSGDALVLEDRPETYTSVKSSINAFGFTVPLMVSQRLVRDFGFSVGAVVNLNTYTTGETKYKVGETEYKENYKNLQQRIFTVDLMASVGLIGDGAIGLYVKYSPMKMFRSGYGPEFNMVSAGLVFGL